MRARQLKVIQPSRRTLAATVSREMPSEHQHYSNCIIGREYASSLRNHTRGMCRYVGVEYVGRDSRWMTVEGQERARGMRLVDHWHCRRYATKLLEPKSNPVAVSGWRNFN